MNGTLTFALFSCLPVLSICFSGVVLADADTPLSVGMSRAEVREAWGKPQERLEQETNRKEMWRYDTGVVTFINHQVSSWKFSGGEQPALEAEAVEEEPVGDSGRIIPPLVFDEMAQKKPAGTDMKSILAEIMDNQPEEKSRPKKTRRRR